MHGLNALCCRDSAVTSFQESRRGIGLAGIVRKQNCSLTKGFRTIARKDIRMPAKKSMSKGRSKVKKVMHEQRKTPNREVARKSPAESRPWRLP